LAVRLAGEGFADTGLAAEALAGEGCTETGFAGAGFAGEGFPATGLAGLAAPEEAAGFVPCREVAARPAEVFAAVGFFRGGRGVCMDILPAGESCYHRGHQGEGTNPRREARVTGGCRLIQRPLFFRAVLCGMLLLCLAAMPARAIEVLLLWDDSPDTIPPEI
jgi:hypothetical protein